jgi:hypothetical protein
VSALNLSVCNNDHKLRVRRGVRLLASRHAVDEHSSHHTTFTPTPPSAKCYFALLHAPTSAFTPSSCCEKATKSLHPRRSRNYQAESYFEQTNEWYSPCIQWLLRRRISLGIHQNREAFSSNSRRFQKTHSGQRHKS